MTSSKTLLLPTNLQALVTCSGFHVEGFQCSSSFLEIPIQLEGAPFSLAPLGGTSNDRNNEQFQHGLRFQLILFQGGQTVTELPKSPLSVELHLGDCFLIEIFLLGIGWIEKQLVFVIPKTKRFVFRGDNLELIKEKARLHLKGIGIIFWAREPSQISGMPNMSFFSKSQRMVYRLEILQASQYDKSPGISSLSNSGLDFNARINHGFQALLEIAESVIPETCLSRLLNACLK